MGNFLEKIQMEGLMCWRAESTCFSLLAKCRETACNCAPLKIYASYEASPQRGKQPSRPSDRCRCPEPESMGALKTRWVALGEGLCTHRKIGVRATKYVTLWVQAQDTLTCSRTRTCNNISYNISCTHLGKWALQVLSEPLHLSACRECQAQL
jgi:hypothetical protein